MSWLALSDSIEYLCYGFLGMINILVLSEQRSTLESDVYRGQILMSKIDPRAVKVKQMSLG